MKFVLNLILAFAFTFTSCQEAETQETMKFNSDAKQKLLALKDVYKFGPEEVSNRFPLGYVGILPETNRPIANKLLNESIDRIISVLDNQPTIEKILNEYKKGLATLEPIALDTEDRERVCEYYDDIRNIIGFESTKGILNDFLY